ncbi:MAG: hypothetical protein LBH43_03090 [Treponema sp.]|jgi:hypothetical protein|nr:hypothetical protein [Treponema sp.]
MDSGLPGESGNKQKLLRLLPPVLRARDFYIYLEGGQRLVDLWLYGGRSALGHKPANTVRELKNAAGRGLFAPFPNVAEKRFVKALAKLFPERRFKVYGSKDSLGRALEKQGLKTEELTDPAFHHGEEDASADCKISLWRPFLEKSISAPLLAPVLPWPFAPWPLVYDSSLDEKNEERFLQSDIVSPVILAPAARAIHDLLAAETLRSKIKFLKIENALNKAECKWQRQGIYLSRKHGAYGDWNGLWLHFLENGFLLPPDPCEPLILPGMISPGEEAKLAGLLGSC